VVRAVPQRQDELWMAASRLMAEKATARANRRVQEQRARTDAEREAQEASGIGKHFSVRSLPSNRQTFR